MSNKFIRVEQSKTEEEFLLNEYEKAFIIFTEEKDGKGVLKNKPEDFKFFIGAVLEIVPANGLTRKTVEGELVREEY